MKNYRNFLWILLAGGALFLFAGCDSEVTDSDLLTGDLNDTEYEEISGIFGTGYTEMSSTMMDLTFELIDSIPGQQSLSKPAAFESETNFTDLGFQYSYDSETYWHYFTVSASGYEEDGQGYSMSYSFTGADSIRFSNSSGYMQYPDETTTGAEFHWNFDIGIESENDYFTFSSEADLDLTGEYEGDYTVNGSSSDVATIGFEDEQVSCDIEIAADQTFNNIYVPASGGPDECPTSGRLDIDASLSVECEGETPEGYDELSVLGNWDISFVFNDGYITATYSDGTTQWTATEECGNEKFYSPRLPNVE